MNTPGYCPESGSKGRRVDSATVKSLLSISLRNIGDVPYYFCAQADCEVVYFSEDGLQQFRKHEIREQVYQKEPANPAVLLCYCFQHTVGDLQIHLLESAENLIVENIKDGIKANQCACDWRNPQGDCCLGNVQQLIRQFKSANKGTQT